MKKYKDFIRELKEDYGAMKTDDTQFTNTIQKASDGSVNLFDVEKPEIVDRLNAAMAFINRKPILDPNERVVEIKMALSHSGIDFDHTQVAVSEGEQVVPATLFGGFMGMNDDGEFVNDGDGFERKTGSKHGVLFSWNKNNGMWTLDSEIVPM